MVTIRPIPIEGGTFQSDYCGQCSDLLDQETRGSCETCGLDLCGYCSAPCFQCGRDVCADCAYTIVLDDEPQYVLCPTCWRKNCVAIN